MKLFKRFSLIAALLLSSQLNANSAMGAGAMVKDINDIGGGVDYFGSDAGDVTPILQYDRGLYSTMSFLYGFSAGYQTNSEVFFGRIRGAVGFPGFLLFGLEIGQNFMESTSTNLAPFFSIYNGENKLGWELVTSYQFPIINTDDGESFVTVGIRMHYYVGKLKL